MNLKRHSGFTLVELLVVVTILTILATLLLPVLRNAVESARQITCANGMKQYAIGVFTYVDDYTGYLPPGSASVGTTTAYTSVETAIADVLFDSKDPFIGRTIYTSNANKPSPLTCPSMKRHQNGPTSVQWGELSQAWPYIDAIMNTRMEYAGPFRQINKVDGTDLKDYADPWGIYTREGGFRKLLMYSNSDCAMFVDGCSWNGNYLKSRWKTDTDGNNWIWNPSQLDGGYGHLAFRHGPMNGKKGTMFNTVFMDGHVKSHTREWLLSMPVKSLEREIYIHGNVDGNATPYF